MPVAGLPPMDDGGVDIGRRVVAWADVAPRESVPEAWYEGEPYWPYSAASEMSSGIVAYGSSMAKETRSRALHTMYTAHVKSTSSTVPRHKNTVPARWPVESYAIHVRTP